MDVSAEIKLKHANSFSEVRLTYLFLNHVSEVRFFHLASISIPYMRKFYRNDT